MHSKLHHGTVDAYSTLKFFRVLSARAVLKTTMLKTTKKTAFRHYAPPTGFEPVFPP